MRGVWLTIGVGGLAGTLTAPVRGKEALRNSLGMKMITVKVGSFKMGSDRRDWRHSPDEGPRRSVYITAAFLMSAHPVTNVQFRRFRPEHQSPPYKGHVQDKDDQPVVSVTWYDAVAFCRWLSEKEGRHYRLPTEAEWEYACLAGARGAYCFGNSQALLSKFAWFKTADAGPTMPVGQKLPNSWGLYDMHGNVWEWCYDLYAPSYAGAERLNPQGPEKGTERVMRGGSVRNTGPACRAANRYKRDPAKGYSNTGFRVVCNWVPDQWADGRSASPGKRGRAAKKGGRTFDLPPRPSEPRGKPAGKRVPRPAPPVPASDAPFRRSRQRPDATAPAPPKRQAPEARRAAPVPPRVRRRAAADWRSDLGRFREAVVKALGLVKAPPEGSDPDERRAEITKRADEAVRPFIEQTVTWQITVTAATKDGEIRFKESFPATFDGTTVGGTNGFVRLSVRSSETALGRWQALRPNTRVVCRGRITSIHTGPLAGTCWIPLVTLTDAVPDLAAR